jgi:hypothetical protein
LATEAVRRSNEIFATERQDNGAPDQRHTVTRERSTRWLPHRKAGFISKKPEQDFFVVLQSQIAEIVCSSREA